MPSIAAQRLHNHKLLYTTFRTPAEIVGWLGAVQSQDYAGATWALALRLIGAGHTTIDQALAEGSILRTHAMRPTWHFVTPTDIYWLLDLTGPRVHQGNAGRYRELELDAHTRKRAQGTLIQVLRGGKQLTRDELRAALEQAGISTEGQRLPHILMAAELDQIICSGGRRGKQFTYALLDERAPQVKRLARDEAVAELTRRYFTSHGPATLQDFAWWSGLTVADGKAGIEMLKPDLVEDVIDGKHYWRPADQPDEIPDIPVLLLPPFDEYTVAYRDHSVSFDPSYGGNGATLSGVMVVAGQVIGNWRRTLSKDTVTLDYLPFRPLTPAESDGFAAAAQRYADHLTITRINTTF